MGETHVIYKFGYTAHVFCNLQGVHSSERHLLSLFDSFLLTTLTLMPRPARLCEIRVSDRDAKIYLYTISQEIP